MSSSDAEVLHLALDELQTTVAGLGERERAWLDEIPVANMIELLDRLSDDRAYGYLGPGVAELAEEVRAQGDEKWLERYLRLLMLALIAREVLRPHSLILPESIREVRAVELRAIVRRHPDESPWPSDLATSRYQKDLGVARGVLLPAGLFVVQRRPELPARLVDACRASDPVLADALGRSGPWLQSHLLQRRVHEFTPEGRLRASRVIADLMEANPEIAGSYGDGGWYTDPAVADISPHLSWVRAQILASGAHVISLGSDPDTVNNATATSRTRRRAYEEGRYEPTRFARICLRGPFIAWARETSR